MFETLVGFIQEGTEALLFGCSQRRTNRDISTEVFQKELYLFTTSTHLITFSVEPYKKSVLFLNENKILVTQPTDTRRSLRVTKINDAEFEQQDNTKPYS